MTVRTAPDGSKQVQGYAIVWNSESVDLGGFTEICSPSMLDRTLKQNPDVLALRDHKQELLLGRTAANTLELKPDSTGLAFTLTLPKTQIGDDTAENVRLRNLSGCSFGFVCRDDSWSVSADGRVVRTLLDIDLFEISITSLPAYSDTSVNTRSCPAELRQRLKADPDDDTDADDSDPDSDYDVEDRCACGCGACETGDCDQCTDPDCDDDVCEACPMQDEARSDRLRLRKLHALRTN
jgi:HK97 family phage prohead protease